MGPVLSGARRLVRVAGVHVNKWLAAGYGAVAVLLVEMMALTGYSALYKPTSLCLVRRGP